MTHVYEGTPDARQSADDAMLTTRFRPKYRALTDAEKALHDEIKSKATERWKPCLSKSNPVGIARWD